MVDRSSQFVARKYAVACLNIFGSRFGKDDMSNLLVMSDFLRENHSLVFFLGLPIIKEQRKSAFLHDLAKQFHLSHLIDQLLDLLLRDKRLFLLADILRLLSDLYAQKMNILNFSIKTYPRISHTDLEELKQFLARSTGCAIIYKDYEDKNLVAGIRMQSTTYLWENSIAQQLRAVRKRTTR